jgi:thiol-disulfide isomerase/thioredoxin
MDKSIWQRRQILSLGLGLVGVGAASAFGANASKENFGSSAHQIDPANAKAMMAADSTQILALQSGNSLPEFQGIQEWLNSSPLTRQDLNGSVALIQFWTYSCINCKRTLPHVTAWHRQYAAKGLKVVGIHTPESPYERKISNVQAAMRRHGITYPVAIDNNFKTWQAYKNEYWPHLFLADRHGNITYDHIGEGAYAETERTIQKLLNS